MCDCPTLYGRLNKHVSPAEMLLRWKDITVNVGRSKTMTNKELEGKIIIGEMHSETKPEYTDLYKEIIKKCGGDK